MPGSISRAFSFLRYTFTTLFRLMRCLQHMKIGFFGAARIVTGSKHIITLDDGRRILLDCGMFQGEGHATHSMNERFHFDPKSIDYVIISHAHTDHIGLLPKLVKEGFGGNIYATGATRDLAEAMLTDSAEIQEEDAEEAFLHHKHRVEPLYRVKDVVKTMRQFLAVPYNRPFEIDKGISLTMTDAGHIVGSATVNLAVTEGGTTRNICFTGDIGRYDMRIIRDPQPFPQADILISESTYGDKHHEDRDEAEQLLLRTIKETCIMKKGKVIIPAFSVGRTQELVFILNKLDFENKIPHIPVFIDSPLSIEITEIVRKHKECFDEETVQFMERDPEPFLYPSLHFVKNPKESMALNDFKGPCIVIASSGMLEAGRIRHHIVHHIEDERNTILLTSYTPPDSLGSMLKRGDKKVKIWDRTFDVRADIVYLEGMSAHGDQAEMLRYLSCQDKNKIQQIFLVHGDYEVQLAYKEKLLQEGYQHITIPAFANVHEV